MFQIKEKKDVWFLICPVALRVSVWCFFSSNMVSIGIRAKKTDQRYIKLH